MAAGGYVTYEAGTAQFSLSEEQALALLDADLPGAFVLAQATVKSEPRITEIFRSGEGMGWHEHDHRLFEGTERFFRPGYAVNLVPAWIPALEGVQAKLEKGGRVADIGCGHGSSTILMAKAFPASRFVGFDYHGPSIDSARQAAKREGVGDRIAFEVASAKDYPGTGYDLVAFFDSLHDMGDPVGIARHVRQSLAPGGTWLLVEPFAHDRLEENLNPVGRMYYAASTILCTPNSLSQVFGYPPEIGFRDHPSGAVAVEGGKVDGSRVGAEGPLPAQIDIALEVAHDQLAHAPVDRLAVAEAREVRLGDGAP